MKKERSKKDGIPQIFLVKGDKTKVDVAAIFSTLRDVGCVHEELEESSIRMVKNCLNGHSADFGNVLRELGPQAYVFVAPDMSGKVRGVSAPELVKAYDEGCGYFLLEYGHVSEKKPPMLARVYEFKSHRRGSKVVWESTDFKFSVLKEHNKNNLYTKTRRA